MEPKTSRLPLPLTPQNERDLTTMRESPNRLSELPGHITPQSSKAKLVHAIFEEGMRVMKERELEETYRRIGEEEREQSKARHARLKGRQRGIPGLD